MIMNYRLTTDTINALPFQLTSIKHDFIYLERVDIALSVSEIYTLTEFIGTGTQGTEQARSTLLDKLRQYSAAIETQKDSNNLMFKIYEEAQSLAHFIDTTLIEKGIILKRCEDHSSLLGNAWPLRAIKGHVLWRISRRRIHSASDISWDTGTVKSNEFKKKMHCKRTKQNQKWNIEPNPPSENADDEVRLVETRSLFFVREISKAHTWSQSDNRWRAPTSTNGIENIMRPARYSTHLGPAQGHIHSYLRVYRVRPKDRGIHLDLSGQWYGRKDYCDSIWPFGSAIPAHTSARRKTTVWYRQPVGSGDFRVSAPTRYDG